MGTAWHKVAWTNWFFKYFVFTFIIIPFLAGSTCNILSISQHRGPAGFSMPSVFIICWYTWVIINLIFSREFWIMPIGISSLLSSHIFGDCYKIIKTIKSYHQQVFPAFPPTLTWKARLNNHRAEILLFLEEASKRTVSVEDHNN